MNRRGFLKSLLAAPLVAVAPSMLWVPPQPELVLANTELVEAMQPLVKAVYDECTIGGYFVNPLMWVYPNVQEIIEVDALKYFPEGRQMVILANPPAGLVQNGGRMSTIYGKDMFVRFNWKGVKEGPAMVQTLRISQCWTNGTPLQPQLWLA